jgi:hypothetical protein
LDESKDNIKKTINEARREISRYTDVISDYQENTIQAIREVADAFIESEKDIIVNSFQLWSRWMISPRLANNTKSANLQTLNTSVQTAKKVLRNCRKWAEIP